MKWNNNEIEFLIKYYEKYGLNYCSEKLNKTKSSVQSKSRRLNLKFDPGYIYKSDYFIEIVKNSNTLSEVCKKLYMTSYYGNRQTIKKYIKERNIDISHFYDENENLTFHQIIELSNILIENSKYTNTTILKERLYKEGLKKRKCELCGQGEIWNDMKISLILDHINGNSSDNRIENLQIVCPNCNAGLETFSGKNVKTKAKNFFVRKEENYDVIRNSKLKSKKYQKKERNENGLTNKQINYILKQRKTERPPYEKLLKEIEELGYIGVGKKYGVSDNSIRKWVKTYKKYKI